MRVVLPAGLSMLWESVDAEVALTERFGFEGFDTAARWVGDVLAQTWGAHVTDCSRLVISDQNAIVWVASDRGGLIVKWSRDDRRFAQLDASTRLLRELAARGVPVSAPIRTRDGSVRAVLDGPVGALSVTVLPELSGDCLEVGDLAAVNSAGACLARLHDAMPRGSARRPEGLRERIEEWLARWDRGFAPGGSRRLSELLAGAAPLTDEPQLVHNDYRAANLLTRNSEVVGVLDFDEVLVDHRVSDLAKASVYLGTRFTDWAPTSRSVRRTLREGYESVRRLNTDEAQWLEVLVLWHGLMAVPGPGDEAGWAVAL